MMRITFSDLSGTSHSPAKETSRPFRGTRYQGVDSSARWGIEGVPCWRSLDFLWPQLRANATTPGQRMMATVGKPISEHPASSKPIQKDTHPFSYGLVVEIHFAITKLTESLTLFLS
ncbi:hypothetical protein AVEN_183755-1 [Araneus ventricosus]|uniref:Uncharacterized protein n=1 Tax=Araneus ventricosus TaxID=182803 RepID=A0A4Y2SQD7_ARAVE|nr:hypothetical protein AVEN_183755-1 [Araneus ventricosus]